jgi:NAD(P)-dependent dehydrogenase (short-subunit alcohol dehydrogenase family)
VGTLDGRCAIITGAAYGIGFAAARRMAEEGASIVIADIKGQEDAVAKLKADGFDALAVRTDVSSDESVNELIENVIEHYGRIDILVNNAAISTELKPEPFENETVADWQRIFNVNVFGVFRLCKAVSPHMRAAKSGRIINVASGTAFKGSAGMLHYIASKGAIITMTRTLANEFGADGINVNAVSPGFTITESVEAAPNMLDFYSGAAVPTRFLKRNAYAPDVGNVIYFLASDDAAFVTGQIIPADGGSVMH